MTISERLKYFIEKNYKSQKDFAEYTNIHTSSINKYTSEKFSPGIDTLLKFQDAGLSIDWLLNGIGIMYAKNSKGFELSENSINNVSIDMQTPFGRITHWILIHFGTLIKFAISVNYNYETLYSALFASAYPDIDLIDTLNNAGCNIEWIITGKGSIYANNPSGEILKSRKYSELEFGMNNPMMNMNHFENTKSFSFDEMVNIIRVALKGDYKNINENTRGINKNEE
jgi:transcriptional regulator with XRE-family HTH domain